jgi:hypothetical protein
MDQVKVMLSLALEQLAKDRLAIWSGEMAQIEFVPEEGSGGGLVDYLQGLPDFRRLVESRT